MIEFYWPSSAGEWLAWCSALVTIGFGFVLFFAPRYSLGLLRLRTAADHPEAVAEMRGTMAGFYFGVGFCCILFAQPLLYLALGVSWAFTAFGRLVSMLFDRGNTVFNRISVVIEFLLAALPLAYVFGYVP
jgi:hypothetical protein